MNDEFFRHFINWNDSGELCWGKQNKVFFHHIPCRWLWSFFVISHSRSIYHKEMNDWILSHLSVLVTDKLRDLLSLYFKGSEFTYHSLSYIFVSNIKINIKLNKLTKSVWIWILTIIIQNQTGIFFSIICQN